MSPTPPLKTAIAVKEYLDGELHSEIKHEYIDGRVYAMGGASRAHGLIVNALAFALTPIARSKRCQLFISDMKVRLDIAGKSLFYYPDLLLTCDPTDRETYFSSHPCHILPLYVPANFKMRFSSFENLIPRCRIPFLHSVQSLFI